MEFSNIASNILKSDMTKKLAVGSVGLLASVFASKVAGNVWDNVFEQEVGITES